jgi:hypothetical protein
MYTALTSWLSALELRHGQILRLCVGVSFWTEIQNTLEKNRAVKLVAVDIYVEPFAFLKPHDSDTLHLLIEDANELEE